MRLLSNLSVAAKFVLTFVSILTVSMVFMGLILYHQASEAAIAQGQVLMMQNVSQMKNNITQKVYTVQSLSQIIAFDPKLQSFLGSDFLNESFQLQDFRDSIAPILDNLMRQNPYIHSIRIYMRNSSIPELYDGFYHLSRIAFDPLYAPFLRDATQTSLWQGMHTEQPEVTLRNTNLQDNVFAFDRKIFAYKYSNIPDMMEIEVDRDVLFESLNNPKYLSNGNIFIIDSQGVVISNNFPEFTGKSAEQLGLPSMPLSSNMNDIVEVNGIDSIVISVPVEDLDLRMVGIFPTTPFISGMKRSEQGVFLFLFGALILLSVIVYFITNALLRRMKVLVKAMKQVREGSLDVSVPVGSNDEFSQMAGSFNMMTRRIHELVEKVYKSQLVEKEAELRALESHINPHFLYNTLATISWVARKVQSPEITHLATSMAKFYRLVLNKGKSVILVQDELEMVRLYTQIQKFRFENMFDVIFIAEGEINRYFIPKNILQPLVENALTHGIEQKRSHGTVIVKASVIEDKLVFKVIDDGVGIEQGRVQEMLHGQIQQTTGSGYAIKNIIERLNGYYGDQYQFEIFSKVGIGTEITIRLPKG